MYKMLNEQIWAKTDFLNNKKVQLFKPHTSNSIRIQLIKLDNFSVCGIYNPSLCVS